jgi:hypothetical protein
MPERLPVPRLSEAGITVMHPLSVSGERPAVLLRALRSGAIPTGDLAELIAFAWTRDDSPTTCCQAPSLLKSVRTRSEQLCSGNIGTRRVCQSERVNARPCR